MCVPYIGDYTSTVYGLLSHVEKNSGEVLVAFCGKARSDRVVLTWYWLNFDNWLVLVELWQLSSYRLTIGLVLVEL